MDENELTNLKEIEARLEDVAKEIVMLNATIKRLRDELDRQRQPPGEEK